MWRILNVEDDENDDYLERVALKKAGLPVEVILCLPNGRAAIDYLAQCERVPDLVLVDVKLPITNGFDVLAWIDRRQERFSCLPVIVISSSELPQDKKRAAELGAFAYVGKAPGFEKLVAAIRAVMLAWTVNAEVRAEAAPPRDESRQGPRPEHQ